MPDKKLETLKEFEVKMKAFSQNPDNGNPAGIVFRAKEMPYEVMADVAKEYGFSESAFLWPSVDNSVDFEIRFFTKNGSQIDMCGHATIAAISALSRQGIIDFAPNQDFKILKLRLSDDSIIQVTCHKDGLVEMQQKQTEYFEQKFDVYELAGILNVRAEDIKQPIELVSTGSKKLMIPLVSQEAVNSALPNFEKVIEFQRKYGVQGLYIFTTDTLDSNSDFYARQFNPNAGINEDPITGVAAAALGAYAAKHSMLPKNGFSYTVEQGYKLGMGGKVSVKVSVNAPITIGGYACEF